MSIIDIVADNLVDAIDDAIDIGYIAIAPIVTEYMNKLAEPWNAAEKAMRAVIAVDLDTKHGAHYCHGCHSDLPNHSERHKPATCRIAALQAALALMEGNSHSRDEAMIEDKKYERDDIYKK